MIVPAANDQLKPVFTTDACARMFLSNAPRCVDLSAFSSLQLIQADLRALASCRKFRIRVLRADGEEGAV